jgi:hypothetical protein
MTPELQTLKDMARQVQNDAATIRRERDSQWWNTLLAIAQENLGPLWAFTAHSESTPNHFTRERTTEFAFAITVPGHRTIYAIFRAYTSPDNAYWFRSYYYGAPVSDGTVANWMVAPRSDKHLMSYHHTFGSAMLAAERPQFPCKVCGKDIGWDAPSGVCSRDCLDKGQGFAP